MVEEVLKCMRSTLSDEEVRDKGRLMKYQLPVYCCVPSSTRREIAIICMIRVAACDSVGSSTRGLDCPPDRCARTIFKQKSRVCITGSVQRGTDCRNV